MKVNLNANAQLEQWADMVRATPIGQRVKAPWSAAMLADDEQSAAVALIHQGVIGASVRMESGGKGSDQVRLYLGRGNVGNPFFRLLGGWSFFGLMVAWLVAALWLASLDSEVANIAGLVLSAIALAYFGVHGMAHYKWAELFCSFGRLGEQTKLGSCAIGAAMALGAIVEFGGRVF